jgi:hypothetical protein
VILMEELNSTSQSIFSARKNLYLSSLSQSERTA